MLFSKKYPNANTKDSYEHGHYIYSDKADNCYMCGRLTHFIELNIEGYICSEECDKAFYDEMFKHALKKDLQ